MREVKGRGGGRLARILEDKAISTRLDCFFFIFLSDEVEAREVMGELG